MKKRFDIHPFFLVSLMQMLRHGEQEQAASVAANELLIAAAELGDDDSAASTAGADGGGLLMLPTLLRQQELGYHVSKATPQPNHGGNEDHEQRFGL